MGQEVFINGEGGLEKGTLGLLHDLLLCHIQCASSSAFLSLSMQMNIVAFLGGSRPYRTLDLESRQGQDSHCGVELGPTV